MANSTRTLSISRVLPIVAAATLFGTWLKRRSIALSARRQGEFEDRWNMRTVPHLTLDRLLHAFVR